MIALLAFVAFVIATTIFVLRAAFEIAADANWGFFFIALGLALMCLEGAVAWGRSRQPS